jgi:hypothetical protein
MSVGDMISGYTYGGRLVTGRVVEMDDQTRQARVTGIDVRDTHRGVFTVFYKDVLTSVPRVAAHT